LIIECTLNFFDKICIILYKKKGEGVIRMANVIRCGENITRRFNRRQIRKLRILRRKSKLKQSAEIKK